MKVNLMDKLKIKIVLLALLVVSCARANSKAKCKFDEATFAISGPSVLREGTDYSFTASGQGLKKPVKVDFQFSGTNDVGSYFEYNIIDQKISSNEIQDYVFDTSKLTSGQYTLSANLTDPYTKATNYLSQAITYQATINSIFIESDKPIYSPGNIINFRVYSVDSETRPRNLNSTSVTFLDSNNNIVQSFANITFDKGMYEGYLQLSVNPTLGYWTLRVDVGTTSVSESFQVQNYVLPTYSVSVTVPSEVPFSDSKFPVTVTAAYTFGENVVGVAVVTFSQQNYYYGFEVPIVMDAVEPVEGVAEPIFLPGPIFPTPQNIVLYTRTLNINSTSQTFNVDIQKDLGITQGNYENVIVTVEFTEQVTQKTASATANVDIVPYTYSIVFTDDEGDSNYYGYLPNSVLNLTLSMAKSDGTPAPAGTNVTVSYNAGCYGYPNTCTPVSGTNNYLLGSSGSVVLAKFNTRNFDYVSYQASSVEASGGYYYGSVQQITLTNSLQLTVLTENPKLESKVQIEVKTNVSSLDNCFCILVSKELLLKAKSVEFKNKVGVFSFTPDFSYAPTSQITCYYYDTDGNITSGQISVSFRNQLPNYLDLDFSSDTVKPGTNLTLKVGSYVNSTVSLSCIDQSVLLLASGNDFAKEDVFGSLDIYNSPNYYSYYYDQPEEQQPFIQINCFALKWNLPYPRPSCANPVPETTTTTAMPTEELSTTEPIELSTALPEVNEVAGEVDSPEPEAPEAELPSMSAPTAVSSAGTSAAPRVRSNFNETFSWITINVKTKKNGGNKGQEKVTITAPDQITSYVCTGVSMHDQYGMGLPEITPSLSVFLPFFIQATFPYYIKRGEILELQIIIFNYLNKTQNVTLSVLRDDAQFVILKPAFNGWKAASSKYSQTFESVSGQPVAFQLVIQPKVLGAINIQINATGPYAGDSVLKTLLVEPEGIPKSITQSVLISKNDTNSNFTASLSCTLPSTAINDTTSAYATIFGDVLGDMLSNLLNLIQMPYGCGEQNMLNFVPDVIALIYLYATGQITEPVRENALAYILDGYISELSYCRTDGSFSAFGNDDPVGSTWLTAYVVKSFMDAKPFIAIDQNVILNALNFVLSKQNPDGSFREDGNIIHKDMQGGSGTGLVALTAYTSICLSLNLPQLSDPKYELARNQSLDYIAANINLTSVYDLAIATYALSLANHTDLQTVASAFWALRVETSDTINWDNTNDNPVDESAWWYDSQPRSEDIEITGYALLYYTNVDLVVSEKIGKYLVSKKNCYGGYGSTQDTVVALAALAGYSTKLRAILGTLNVHFQPNLGIAFDAQVNSANLFTVQTFDLNPLARQLNVSSGVGSKGTAIASITCNFYVLAPETAPRFIITQEFIRPCNNQLLQLQVCLSYITRDNDYVSNMVVMETRLPSGYTHDSDFSVDPIIRKLDTQNAGTITEVYIDKLTNETICFDLHFIQTSTVTNLQPASLVLWDYYDKTVQAQSVFSVPTNLTDCADLPPETTTTSTTDSYGVVPGVVGADYSV